MNEDDIFAFPDSTMNEEDIFTITDSTSAPEVVSIVENDEGKLFDDDDLYIESNEFASMELREDASDAEQYVEKGLNIAKQFNDQLNLRSHVFHGAIAKYAIQFGQVLLTLKRLVKGSLNQNWEIWAAENISFLKQSRRQIYMRIADYKPAHQYAFLGLARLNLLVQVVKKNTGDDSIGDFLRSNEIKISFDENQSLNLPDDMLLKDLNLQIDTAIAMEKIANKKIKDVKKENIKELIGLGTKIDKKLIKRLKEEQKKDREPNEYLGILIANLGATPGNDNNKRHPASFNRQAATMSDTIDQYVEDDGLLNEVEETLVTNLFGKLDSLRKRIAERKGVDQS